MHEQTHKGSQRVALGSVEITALERDAILHAMQNDAHKVNAPLPRAAVREWLNGALQNAIDGVVAQMLDDEQSGRA